MRAPLYWEQVKFFVAIYFSIYENLSPFVLSFYVHSMANYSLWISTSVSAIPVLMLARALTRFMDMLADVRLDTLENVANVVITCTILVLRKQSRIFLKQ